MKIGLLAGSRLSEFRLNTLTPILADPAFAVKVALVDARPRPSAVRRLQKNLRLGRGGYVLIMALQRLRADREAGVDTDAFCTAHGIDVVRSDKPYAEPAVGALRAYGLDVLLLVGGFGIVKEPLLSLAPLGVLSYHHGDMRRYRGMPPAFWELYNGEKEMGLTVQVLAGGLDCGVPVEEKTIGIEPQDDLASLRSRAFKASEPMMHDALRKLSNPAFRPRPLQELGTVYTLPNLRQWAALQMRMLARQRAPAKAA